jgi:hypothetical protein
MQTVKFKNKIVESEKNGEKVEIKLNYKEPSGKVYKEGDEVEVTDKAAVWLSDNGFIEPVKKAAKRKNSKEAETRETK